MAYVYQPPSVISLGGWRTKVKSVRLLVGDKPLTFTQNDLSLRITGLPATAPDDPATVIAIECEGEPTMSQSLVKNSAALQCGISYPHALESSRLERAGILS